MAIELMTEVMDYAPRDLKHPELTVLLVLAESANRETRLAWPGHEKLLWRARLTEEGLRRLIVRMEQKGLLSRVPIGTNEKGRPVYAAKGHRTVYKLPAFQTAEGPKPPWTIGASSAPWEPEPLPAIGPLGEQSPYPEPTKPLPAVGQSPYREAPKPPPTVGPSLQDLPSNPLPSTSLSPLEQFVRDASGAADDDETRALIEKIKRENNPHNLRAYIKGMAADLPDHLDELRRGTVVDESPARLPVPPWCGQCDSESYRWVDVHSPRPAPCPTCSSQAVARAAAAHTPVKLSTTDQRVADAQALKAKMFGGPKSRRQQETDSMFERAMARAIARDQAREEPKMSTTDQRVADALALAARYREQEQRGEL